MKKIFHILPSNGIGGVEEAAKSSIDIRSKDYSFKIMYLSREKNNINLISRFISAFQSFQKTLFISLYPPDYILVSLWKSCLSGLIISMFRPNVKIILFLHLPNSINLLDYFFTKLISRKAFEVWGDSNQTLKKRCNELSINKSLIKRKISFIKTKIEVKEFEKEINLNFIFWGRIHKQKRIDKAIHLLYEINKKLDLDFNFSIIGPDCGETNNLKKLIKAYNLSKRINFLPSMEFKEIIKISKNFSFFLQLSDTEGMGMSVVESMQLGLIPIVTNVGEIGRYCCDGKNSLIYKDISTTSKQIIDLLNSNEDFMRIRNQALETWKGKMTYKENLHNNFIDIIKKDL